ncbi:MAG: ornithine carbamoyltransferase [Pseudomonadota bacterium]
MMLETLQNFADVWPSPAPNRSFLDIADFSAETLREILANARAMKAARQGLPKGAPDPEQVLNGHAVAMIFEKASTRTRISFEVGIRQMGGQAVVMSAGDMQLGRGETISDTAKVLSRFADCIMIRANKHDDVEALAANASIPIINGLTDLSHPCQIMADLMTIEEHLGALSEQKLVWLGDCNNVARSTAEAAGILGMEMVLCTPPQHGPDAALLAMIEAGGWKVSHSNDPESAITGASVVMTDTWISMGDEHESIERRHRFSPFQVDSTVMGDAREGAIFMHCLPAHRGEEVTAEVIDGPQSVVWDQAENRLHAQKAILRFCLNQ